MPRSIYLDERYAAQYDVDRFGTAFGCSLEQDEVETFLSLIDEEDHLILDVGGGTGKLSLPLLSQSRKVMTADKSPQMLSIAAEKANARGLALAAVVCDAHALNFDDRSFDCVVSSRLLMHLVDWRKAVAEFCRVARRTVVIDFPPIFSSSGCGASLRRFQKMIGSDVQTYRVFRVKSVAAEFRRNGFDIVHVQRQYFVPVAVHRWIDRPEMTRRLETACRSLGLVRLAGAPATLKAARTTI